MIEDRKTWTVSFLFIIMYRYILQREDSRWRWHQLCTAHLAGQVENRIGTSRQLGHFEEGNKEIKRKLDFVVYIFFGRAGQCSAKTWVHLCSLLLHKWHIVRLLELCIRSSIVTRSSQPIACGAGQCRSSSIVGLIRSGQVSSSSISFKWLPRSTWNQNGNARKTLFQLVFKMTYVRGSCVP